MSYLITSSLLISWQWFLNSESDDSEIEWLQTLNREQTPDNDDLVNGRAFETRVRLQNEPDGKFLTEKDMFDLRKTEDKENDLQYMSTVKDIAEKTEGGIWQIPFSKDYCYEKTGFVLYGRLDVLKLGITDVKFSHTFEKGKYWANPQARMYVSICDGAPWIKFLISDGKLVYEDFYLKRDIEPIYPLINQFWDWLCIHKRYMDIYTNKWVSKETRR